MSREKCDTTVLINFTVEHFRSFGAEQTLNMAATGLGDHPGHCAPIPGTDKSALQVGVLYGANASGKSNLVKAIQFARQMVLGRTSLKALALNRFRFTAKPKPTSFEFRFLARGRVFVYGFTATQDAVLEEWLDAASDSGREHPVFERKKQDTKPGDLRPFGTDGKVARKALGALKLFGVRDDQLVLNKIAEMPDQHRGELFTAAAWWFAACLDIVQAESQFAPLVDVLNADKAFREFCAAFLQNVGTGINALSVKTARIPADKVPKALLDQLQTTAEQDVAFRLGGPGVAIELDAADPTTVVRKNLVARHPVGDEEYPIAFQEESDGTQRCLDLLPALYHLTQESKVFVVDEIDRSLHPHLCRELLKVFLGACPGEPRQLIVTTHETHLLDLDLLRRDEVWFVEKDHDRQQSRLSSLVEFKPRKDLQIEKGYLQGRFGGIPFVGDTKKLLDMIRSPAHGTRHEKKAPA
jgi:uncharacterized protein